MSENLIPFSEVAKHNTEDDCWVIVFGVVYDLTKFLHDHPGGSGVILRAAGSDATEVFEPLHSKDILSTLPDEMCKGKVDPATVPVSKPSSTVASLAVGEKPHIDRCLNLFDFEAVAKSQMKPEGWAYYSSGADDEVTLRENHAAFHRLWLRPRVMIDVSKVDTSCSILGFKSSAPIYLTATALGKLAHPDGEVAVTRAAGATGLIHMLPILSSCTLDELLTARVPGQTQFFQLYVNSNRDLTAQVVKRAAAGGCKALFVTVDAPSLGRREKDMRHKFVDVGTNMQKEDRTLNRSQGAARAIASFIDPSLSWKDIEWLKSLSDMKLCLKGIQCVEDAVIAGRMGCAAIVLSNHGGRQLDFAPSGIEILPAVMDALRSEGLCDMEVYVDGGIRRGSDVLKAIALGATAVGIGRPALYGLASYGQAGVEGVIDCLTEELEMCMKLCGAPSIRDIRPSMVDSRQLTNHVNAVPTDNLSRDTYQRMLPIVPSRL